MRKLLIGVFYFSCLFFFSLYYYFFFVYRQVFPRLHLVSAPYLARGCSRVGSDMSYLFSLPPAGSVFPSLIKIFKPLALPRVDEYWKRPFVKAKCEEMRRENRVDGPSHHRY